MKAIITVGVSASGKTTWAREYAKKHKAIIANRDDMRFSLTGSTGWENYKFDKKIEDVVTNLQICLASNAAKAQREFILSDTNLNAERRTEWVKRLENLGYDEVEIKDFPITLEEAWKRDAMRGQGVGRDVIYKQWQQWLEYTGRKRYVPDESLPKAVIFDIDGTLAHMDGRGPFDWSKVGGDKVDEFVKGLFVSTINVTRVVVSGRDSVCKTATTNWLYQNQLYWDELLMREAGDTRKDTIIKEEIFWRDIAPKYNVIAVVDDRPCVVRMWHDIGVPKVVAVGNQSMEF